jgi:hypothetical protein
MLDVVYVLSIAGFFGLMIAFVRGLERLGHDATAPHDRETP